MKIEPENMTTPEILRAIRDLMGHLHAIDVPDLVDIACQAGRDKKTAMILIAVSPSPDAVIGARTQAYMRTMANIPFTINETIPMLGVTGAMLQKLIVDAGMDSGLEPQQMLAMVQAKVIEANLQIHKWDGRNNRPPK